MKLKKGVSKGQQLFKNESQIIKKTYQEAFEEYITTAKVRGLAEDTIRTYYHHHKYFTEFLGSNKNCSGLDYKTIESYVSYLQEKGIKGTTINSYLQNVSPILKHCVKRGYILQDFNVPYVKVQEEYKEILTEEELNTLLQPPKGKDFVSVRVLHVYGYLLVQGLERQN